MKVFLKIGLMFTFSLLTFLAGAQSIKVSGQVISKDDNAGLSGASVVVKAKNTGTQTDAEGRFSIEAAIGDVLGAVIDGGFELTPVLQKIAERSGQLCGAAVDHGQRWYDA